MHYVGSPSILISLVRQYLHNQPMGFLKIQTLYEYCMNDFNLARIVWGKNLNFMGGKMQRCSKPK